MEVRFFSLIFLHKLYIHRVPTNTTLLCPVPLRTTTLTGDGYPHAVGVYEGGAVVVSSAATQHNKKRRTCVRFSLENIVCLVLVCGMCVLSLRACELIGS